MPEPEIPTLPSHCQHKIPGVTAMVFGENQPEYTPVHALVSERGRVTVRFSLSDADMLSIVRNHGSVWLQFETFHNPLQPFQFLVAEPRPSEL